MMKLVFSLFFIFIISASSESVRETETWVPPGSSPSSKFEGSGGFPDDKDFSFQGGNTLDSEDYDDDDDDDDSDEYAISGSGEGSPVDEEDDDDNSAEITKVNQPDSDSNDIPEEDVINKVDDTIQKSTEEENEVVKTDFKDVEVSSNEVMPISQVVSENFFEKTEVLAALIAGGAVGLLFASLLILLLIYRMKKKDEGSYDLGRKPIYTKAPTTEIYA
ncbi:syndecan-4 isoform X2 [Erpetoichthys calabaricus]|uniref:syndecan-4 isoform X2 n=1 Tax=Erpetoichthys calabaricus TaxID=27687 RepID=UPI0010A0A9AA|nr:syndecan-4 isoform X2 [Erpetoichthys calabaricus]